VVLDDVDPVSHVPSSFANVSNAEHLRHEFAAFYYMRREAGRSSDTHEPKRCALLDGFVFSFHVCSRSAFLNPRATRTTASGSLQESQRSAQGDASQQNP
jgi:hypothetical protein